MRGGGCRGGLCWRLLRRFRRGALRLFATFRLAWASGVGFLGVSCHEIAGLRDVRFVRLRRIGALSPSGRGLG